MDIKSNNSDTYVVITSINHPSERLKLWLDLGYNVVVVGDKNTDDFVWGNYKNANLTYLSYDHCKKRWTELSDLIGYKTYARKNFGYLHAASVGAKAIFETDDDTFLRPIEKNLEDFFMDLEMFEVNFNSTHKVPVLNPFEIFAPEFQIWARGFPISRINDRPLLNQNPLENSKTAFQNIDVIQTLVNLDPDVDAIFRMSSRLNEIDLPISEKLITLSSALVPGNTQSTYWKNKQKYHWTYIPTSVSIRFCDILKMYVAQTSCTIGYAGFITEQFRNPHNLMHDFELEVEMHLKILDLISCVYSNKNLEIYEIYEKLAKIGVVTENDHKGSYIFHEEMNKLV